MDASLYRDINHFAIQTAWAHSFMKVYAVYGVAIFGILVIAAWWFSRYQPDAPRAVAASVWAAAATVIAVGINQPIVAVVHRPRPFLAMPGSEVLVARTHDFSFPSDHGIAAGAATAGLWIVAHYAGKSVKRIAIISTLLALLLAFARVYVGAHYPGDVVAGLIIGSSVTILGWLVLNRALTRVTSSVARRNSFRTLVVAANRG